MSDQSATGTKSPKAGSAYNVYRQGWLLKSPPRSVRKKLHRYWFVLFKQKDMLAFLYFQDEDHYLERKKNEGFFRIDDCTSIDVVPEHLGRKNAFCISTPRSKYYLVSESRYEMGYWLLALHEAMEDFKNSTGQRSNSSNKKKTRSRSTTSPPPVSTTNNTSSLTRKIKPSRPAPPAPPKDKKKGDEENVPPASLPTETQQTKSASALFESIHDTPSSPTTNKLDDIVAGFLQEADQPNTLEYSMMEDEDISPLLNGRDSHNGEETGSISTSLPALNDNSAVNGEGETNSDEASPSPPPHTRHLSFTGSYEFQGKREGKKKSMKRRSGSMKGRRSVSPPNLPPPPPPPTDEPSLEYSGENVINTFEQDETQKENVSNKSSPRPPPPQRTTSLSQKQRLDTGVGDYLDEAFSQEDDQMALIMQTGGEKKSPGILRKTDQSKSPKRNVAFDERVKGRYEPMVDHESLPSSVAEAKARLFGDSEPESFKYKRLQEEQRQGNEGMIEAQDELLEAIETALQPTSYMEQGKKTKPGFTVDIGPPTVPPPVRSPQEDSYNGEEYLLETSPTESACTRESPTWTKPSLDDTPTTSTFSAGDHETMYRSFV